MRMAYLAGGGLDGRALAGVLEAARHWPGRITVVTDRDETPHDEFDVLQTADPAAALRRHRFDIVGALLRPELAYLTDHAPTLYTAEVDRRIRTELLSLAARTTVDRLRIAAGQVRLDRTYRAMARRAAGLHCNGRRAWKSYGHLNPRSLFVVDHRILAADLDAARERPTWDGTRPLRVAFSGRVTKIKGPDLVVEVARRLPDLEFVVLGDGDLRASLEASAPSNVTFPGFVPFDEWKSLVRERVDVALLPHPQGDPSCTYFEFLGSGVPVVGLRNSTWSELAADGLGWAEADVTGLVARLRRLRPVDLDAARTRGIDAIKPYEETVATRMQHMAAVARACGSVT